MGSVSSTSSNVSNLLQALGAESPALASLLSTSKMQSALEKASPGDLVQLSDQAMQLQQVGLLFGSTDGTQSNAFNPASDSLFSILGPASSDPSPDPLIQALESSLGLGGANPATSSSSTATQIANSTSSLQAQELDSLFGSPQTVDPFLNTLG
jgi:hypothetical protein